MLENQLSLNTLVWAKLSGYPWWPAYVKGFVGDKVEVCYLGDFTRSMLMAS